ncbi:MAG: hypothetical protein VB082_01350 [Christensenella sp.]|nr:hypothetical protein [Christensenella sp.]
MITIFKIKVYNVPGVLDRIAGLFRHYGWNIDNLSAGEVERGVTQIKIIYRSRYVDENLLHDKIARMDYVQSWEICRQETHIMRETVVLRIKEELCDPALLGKGKVLYRDGDMLLVECTDTPWKIEELLASVEYVSCDRSGVIGIFKTEEAL